MEKKKSGEKLSAKHHLLLATTSVHDHFIFKSLSVWAFYMIKGCRRFFSKAVSRRSGLLNKITKMEIENGSEVIFYQIILKGRN